MRRAHPNLWSLNRITLISKKLMRLATFSRRRASPPSAKTGIALVCKSGSPQGPDGGALLGLTTQRHPGCLNKGAWGPPRRDRQGDHSLSFREGLEGSGDAPRVLHSVAMGPARGVTRASSWIPDSVAMGPARVVTRSSARIPPGGHGPCPGWSHVTVSAGSPLGGLGPCPSGHT